MMDPIFEAAEDDSGSDKSQIRVFLIPIDNSIKKSQRRRNETVSSKTPSHNNRIIGRRIISPSNDARLKIVDMDSSSDESIETILSSDLFSMHKYSKPKEKTLSDYLFCHNIVEEVKGTFEDAVSACDQIWNAFTITQGMFIWTNTSYCNFVTFTHSESVVSH